MINSSRPPVLFLTHNVPYPPDKGERIRAYNILRWLSRRASVYLAALAVEPVSEATRTTLARDCREVAIVPLCWAGRRLRAIRSFGCGGTVTEGAFASPELRATLRRWASSVRFRVSLASSSSMVPYLRMPEIAGVPAVVDLIDVDSQKWFDYAAGRAGPRSWFYRLEGRRLRRLERSLGSWTRAVTLVSEAEAELYRRAVGGGPVHAVPLGVGLDDALSPADPNQQDCVFVGVLNYHPNVEGLEWFCREVWPELHRRRPTSRLLLVGRTPNRAVQRLASLPGVVLVGQVRDVRPHVAGAAVAIAPLRIARGVQTKVLEGLAMGKAMVVTPQALEGLRAEPGVDLLVASTRDEWVGSIDRLLADPALRARLGGEGRRYVEAHHSWEQCLEPLASLLGLETEPGAAPAHSTRVPLRAGDEPHSDA